jgi:hypothetical protein
MVNRRVGALNVVEPGNLDTWKDQTGAGKLARDWLATSGAIVTPQLVPKTQALESAVRTSTLNLRARPRVYGLLAR